MYVSAQFPRRPVDFQFPSEQSDRGIAWLGVILPVCDGDGVRVLLIVPAELNVSKWDFRQPDAALYEF